MCSPVPAASSASLFLVAGGLLTWGNSFATSNVRNVRDHFIAIPSEMPYGGVYAKISAAAIANPRAPP